MVRLKDIVFCFIEVVSIVSIPYGSIKRAFGSVAEMSPLSFNSLWFD